MTMNRVVLKTQTPRILIIKPSAIGDVVHALPVWNLIRRRWPGAKISWLVTPACAGLLEGLPDLELIRFDRKRLGKMWKNPKVALELLRFAGELRRHRFDLVVDLQGLFRSGWMAWQTRAPIRIGFANAREGAWLFYTHRVRIDTMEQHAIERYLKMAEVIGCETQPVEFPFATTDAERAQVADMLPRDKRFVVLLPGTNWPTKRWPVESFAELVEPLRQRFGLETVVAGGPDAVELAGKIPGSINLAGKTNLRQLVALLEKAELVIANDSGPMHIAAALKRPLVAIFGPTNPVRTGPYDRMDTVVRVQIECAPCYSRSCSHLSCMKWLLAESVLRRGRTVGSGGAKLIARRSHGRRHCRGWWTRESCTGHSAAGAEYRPVGFIDGDANLAGTSVGGLPVLGHVNLLPKLWQKKVRAAVVAIGDGRVRESYAKVMEESGFTLVNAIHPAACVSPTATLGKNVVIAAGAVVCTEARVADSAIINTSAVVDHECEVGRAAHVCPGVLLAGRVRIGNGAFIGLGAKVIQCLSVGDYAVVGAGAVVIQDVPAGATVVGIPARVIKVAPAE